MGDHFCYNPRCPNHCMSLYGVSLVKHENGVRIVENRHEYMVDEKFTIEEAQVKFPELFL